jgi:hypothetical protein
MELTLPGHRGDARLALVVERTPGMRPQLGQVERITRAVKEPMPGL